MTSVLSKETMYDAPAGLSECEINLVRITPISSSLFQQGSKAEFDMPSSGFLDPSSLTLSYTIAWTLTGATANTQYAYVLGDCAHAPISQVSEQFGSQTVSTINNYNLCMKSVIDLTQDIAQKMSNAVQYGLGLPGADSDSFNYENRRIDIDNSTYSVSAPLPCLISSCEKLVPLQFMPNVRIALTFDSASSICYFGAPTTTITSVSYTISNIELRARIINFSDAVTQMIKNQGEEIFIKSQCLSVAGQVVPASSSGMVSLNYNQRYASVKNLWNFYSRAGNTAGAQHAFNKQFDSVNPGMSAAISEFSYYVNSKRYPQSPLTTNLRPQIMSSLKEVVGSVYDVKNSAGSVSVADFGCNNDSNTSSTLVGKFYTGVSTEKINGSYLLTGVQTANSPITLELNLGSTPTTNTVNAYLICNYDAIISVKPNERAATVRT